MSIIEYLSQERVKFVGIANEFIENQINQFGGLTPVYKPYLKQIQKYLLQGGKWHRPTLVLLAYKIAGGENLENVSKAAVAVEFMHRYLLIHDDIVDQDLMRHGGSNLEKVYQDYFKSAFPHKKDVMFSKGVAMIGGDIVESMVHELLAESGLSKVITINAIRGFHQMMMETAAGWQLQAEQNYQNIEDVSFKDVDLSMQLVSAQYSMVWPLRMGEIFVGLNNLNEFDTNLDEFGLQIGIAFQIIDDVLGIFGDEIKTGKPVGNDYREGKKTYLTLYAYQQANTDDKHFIKRTLGTNVNAAELAKVKSIITKTGALDYAKKLAEEHLNKGLIALRQLDTKSLESVKWLEKMAKFMVERSY